MYRNNNPAVISYARADGEIALRLVKNLRDAGASVWLDQLDIHKGQPWDDSIQMAIRNASDLIVLLSKNSVISPNVKDEIAEAFDSKVRIIPVRISECKVPLRLKRMQYIDATFDEDDAVKDILTVLKSPNKSMILPKRKLNLSIISKIIKLFNILGKYLKSLSLYVIVLIVSLIGIYIMPFETYKDYTIIPFLNESSKQDIIVNASQLKFSNGRLISRESPITTNGYFTYLIPKYEGIKSHPDAKDSGGVNLTSNFDPNIFITVQVKPIKDINTIDLSACGISLVVKIRSKALFFWASESDASPQNIPIDINFENLNTIGLRQVGRNASAFINGKLMAQYTFNTKPKNCSPSLYFKVNTDKEGEAYFQGLASYEFKNRNIFGLIAPQFDFYKYK